MKTAKNIVRGMQGIIRATAHFSPVKEALLPVVVVRNKSITRTKNKRRGTLDKIHTIIPRNGTQQQNQVIIS